MSDIWQPVWWSIFRVTESLSLTLKMTIAHVVETSVNVSNKKNNGVLNWTILVRKIRIWREDNTDNIIASLKMMVRRIKGFLIFDKNVWFVQLYQIQKMCREQCREFHVDIRAIKGWSRKIMANTSRNILWQHQIDSEGNCSKYKALRPKKVQSLTFCK